MQMMTNKICIWSLALQCNGISIEFATFLFGKCCNEELVHFCAFFCVVGLLHSQFYNNISE